MREYKHIKWQSSLNDNTWAINLALRGMSATGKEE